MQLKGKLCLVTGGAGFIGSHLVDKLIKKGSIVRVLDNLATGKLDNISSHLNNKKFEFISGSVTEGPDVERAVNKVDIIFHLACLGVRHSISHPFENHRVNAEGALIVLDAAYKSKVKKLIYCSSSEVYGTAQNIPMSEDHPTNPCTVYGSSKLAGEAYARAYHKTYGMHTVILRPFNTYGPRSHHEGDAGEVIPKSIVRALNKQPIIVFGNGLQTRDFTFVEDTARAMVLAAENDNMIGQTFNIGNNFEVSIKDLAQLLLKQISDKNVNIEFTPGRPGDVLRLFADSSKFRQSCGWRPETDFEEGLRKTIDYFRNHPLGIKELIKAEAGRNWNEVYK